MLAGIIFAAALTTGEAAWREDIARRQLTAMAYCIGRTLPHARAYGPSDREALVRSVTAACIMEAQPGNGFVTRRQAEAFGRDLITAVLARG